MNDNNRFNKELGFHIRQARLLKKISQETLAERLGVVKQTVQRYEEGRIVISADAVRICAEVLGTTVADLYGAETTPPTAKPDRIAILVAAEIMALPNDDIRKKLFVLAKAINNGWSERDAA